MNALVSQPCPLPAILDTPRTGPQRRRRIERLCLPSSGVDLFNRLLERLGRPPIDCDRLATAGRELCVRSNRGVVAVMIGQRMRRAAQLALMSADAGWTAANDALDTAALVVEYVRRSDDLIPDPLPAIGHLDDAIVVDAGWPRLVGEVADYLDFRRLRRIEAALRDRDVTRFGFTRGDWQQARMAEAALAAHQRQVRDSSYLPRASALFRVH